MHGIPSLRYYFLEKFIKKKFMYQYEIALQPNILSIFSFCRHLFCSDRKVKIHCLRQRAAFLSIQFYSIFLWLFYCQYVVCSGICRRSPWVEMFNARLCWVKYDLTLMSQIGLSYQVKLLLVELAFCWLQRQR